MMGDIAGVLRRTTTCATSTRCRISGYHIAEAGANPISQLAFTLANGFTFVEAYLARGMHIDDFAPNLSFFFSNGMDPEYTVLGRVARRIWAVAMRDRYGANERSQKLKYHVQTSGRSLHAQEIELQRHPHHAAGPDRHLRQLQLACTPTPTTRRSPRPPRSRCAGRMAIQLIINREWGLADEREPAPGLLHHRRADRPGRGGGAGGVRARSPSAAACSGAMETGYQRGRIQDESMLYEHRKHDGELPIVGVNTFRNPHGDAEPPAGSSWPAPPRRRSSRQLRPAARLPRAATRARRPRRAGRAAAGGRDRGGNVFAVLMDAVRVLLAAADHRRAVRGGRAVPPQHVTVTRAGRTAATSDRHVGAQDRTWLGQLAYRAPRGRARTHSASAGIRPAGCARYTPGM